MKAFIIGLVAVAVLTVFNALFIVDQREQVMVLQFGEQQRVVQEPGLYFKIPFIQNLVRFDKRILDLNAEANEVIAADQKRLIVDAFVKYRISNPLKFYQSVRTQSIAEQRLDTFLDSSLRQVVGSVKQADMLTVKRTNVMRAIFNEVKEKSKALGIEVVDVRVMRADFPRENSEAIYRSMQTEREREAKEFRARGAEDAQRIRSRADKDKAVILANAEKKAQMIRGTGEAKATKIFADAFNRDTAFYEFYRTMQAYRNTLGKDDTSMVLSPDSEFLRYFGDMSGKRRKSGQ